MHPRIEYSLDSIHTSCCSCWCVCCASSLWLSCLIKLPNKQTDEHLAKQSISFSLSLFLSVPLLHELDWWQHVESRLYYLFFCLPTVDEGLTREQQLLCLNLFFLHTLSMSACSLFFTQTILYKFTNHMQSLFFAKLFFDGFYWHTSGKAVERLILAR